VRSAAQISRTPREWKDSQAIVRERILAELLAILRDARERELEWYAWILERREQLERGER
jgi:hypothetical protein